MKQHYCLIIKHLNSTRKNDRQAGSPYLDAVDRSRIMPARGDRFVQWGCHHRVAPLQASALAQPVPGPPHQSNKKGDRSRPYWISFVRYRSPPRKNPTRSPM